MSSRKTKKSQKLGSSRRYNNRNRENEERENDDGFQDFENEHPQNEKSQFLTVSENQSSNESSLLHSDQPVIACSNPNTSVLELSCQPQSQDFTDLLGQAEVTSKQRKMGSTRKGKRNFKFEGIYEDEPEHQVQLCEGISDEQGVSEDASIKVDEGKKVHTSLLACAASHSEHESSILQGKHLALGTTVQNEDIQTNEEHQHLEAALQSKLMDISSSELNISNENSSATQPDSNVPLQELNESLEIYHPMDNLSEPVASLPITTGQAIQIDTTCTPLNGNREQSVQMSQNNLLQNDKPSMAEHTVLKTIDTQSSLNVVIRDKQEDTKILEGHSAKDIRQDEVLSASLINEHEQETEDNKVATVILENVGNKASTEDEKRFDQCLEHKYEQLTEESIDKFESTEFREDNDTYKELYVAVDETDNDLGEGVSATNLNPPIESDTSIISPLKLEAETSSEQVLSYEFKFQGDSEIKCYRKEKNDLPEARCLTGESSADKEIFKKDMQSANYITESQLIPDETLYKETEANNETCNLQHNNPEEFPTELEAGDCSDQMLDKVFKDTSESSDIETEVIKKENNEMKEEINAGFTESFTMEDFTGVDDEKAGTSTFMDELEMESVITDTQDYACTVQASMVVNEHCIESPTEGSASLVHVYPTSDLVEQIPEMQGKLDMQVYCPIAIPDQEQSMSDECQVNPSNIESEAKQCESTISIVYIQKSLGHDDSLAENEGFSLSEKNQIDSILNGLNLGGNQKDSFKAIKETIQAHSLDETPTSEDGTLSFTSETCYPQSAESLKIMEPEADKMEENVIKAVVKNEDTSGEEKALAFKERSTFLGPENEVSKEKDNNKREEINSGATENLTMEAKCTQQYMRSEMSSQNISSSQIIIKHLSPVTEHPDFKKDDGNSTENVKNRNTEIHTQVQTKKKKKFGSTRRPHGGHQLLAEREEGEDQEMKWKDLENTEELKHQIITEAATSNLLNEPQNTMSEVTFDIYGLPVTIEQKQTRAGEINTPPAILSVEVDQIYPVVSYEVSNAEKLTNIIEQNEKPRVHKEKDSEFIHLNKQVKAPVITKIQDHAFTEHVSLAVQMHINEKPENECANKVNVHSTCGPVELIPETQVKSDMQKTTESFHTVVSDHNLNITEEHLENLTNRESESEQLESTSTCIQIEELKSSQVDSIKENVELSSSEESRNTDLTRKSFKGQLPGSDQKNKFEVIKENKTIQEQNMDQNGTKIGVIKEDSNDTKEEINASLTENLTQKDITTVCSQQHVLCDLSFQTTDQGFTAIEHPSPATEHPDFRKDYRIIKENVDNINADIHPQIQAKKKKKFGSTRRPHERHQLPAEGEEGEWKDMENTEENEQQIITQAASLNFYTESQITMSEVTLDIHNSSVTTEQQQIITTEGTENIDSLISILSIETDQTHTVVFDAVINAEGLTEIVEQNEKNEVNELKNDKPLHLNELKMAPVITKIQDDAFIEHVSLVKMPSDKCSANECVSEVNIHSTYENVENRSAEIHTQTQTKKMKKFGSTRRPHGRPESPAEVAEREWMDLENTEKIQSTDETRFDMPVVFEQYHTMSEEPLENRKNTELKPEQCEITCPVVHIQELKLAPGDLAAQNLGDRNSGKRKKIGSTRRSLRVMKGKENIQEHTTEESTPNSEKDGAQKETFNLNTEISHQSIQKHFEPLNIIEYEAEKMGSTCENLEVKQNKEEAWQRTTDLNPRFAGDNHLECLKLVSKEDIVNSESNVCATTPSRQENEPHIHHKLDQSEDFLHTEIELYLNKSLESSLNTTALNPNISEFSESISEGSLQLQSSPNPQNHMEPSSPARRRKMGSSRKMSKNKNANVTNNEHTIDARTVTETVMAEGTEDMEECVQLSEVQALSQINESSAQATGQQLSEDRRKFGSRCTAKASSELCAIKDGEYESNQKKTEIQVTKGELRVSDLGYISEPEHTLISPPVSEPRPGIEEVRKTVATNTPTEDGVVSLDRIRKTMPPAVSTGERQKIDFEQWNEQIPDFGQAVYNVVMVGNSNVGKTSFMKRLQSGHFIPDYSATIGVDTFVHTVTFGSRTVKMYVWDTAGQERYQSITRQVFHKAQGLLLMYDITSSQSFHAVRAWISQVQEKASPDVILMLLGNKNDCAHREVQLQDGEDLSKEYNIHFMECSAATGENLSESLKTLAWLLVKQRVRKEEEHTTLQPKPQNKKSGCC